MISNHQTKFEDTLKSLHQNGDLNGTIIDKWMIYPLVNVNKKL